MHGDTGPVDVWVLPYFYLAIVNIYGVKKDLSAGTLTVTHKAHIAGLIMGALDASKGAGAGQAAQQQLLQRLLARELRQSGATLDKPAFSNRQACSVPSFPVY